jgi:hypothetical protein
MMEKELLAKKDPYYSGDNGMILHKIISSNYKKLCRITDDITRSRCDSIYRNMLSMLKSSDYKDNIIEYLAEGGRPLFIPFKDNKVLYIGPETEEFKLMEIFVRAPGHAFTDKCRNMLSMNYDYIEFHQAYPRYFEYIEKDVSYNYISFDDYLKNDRFDTFFLYKNLFVKVIGDLANGDPFVMKQLFYFFAWKLSNVHRLQKFLLYLLGLDFL